MEIIVNGKLENLDYIISTGENIASDIILNNEERLNKVGALCNLDEVV